MNAQSQSSSTFAQRLRQLRHQRGISQGALARRADLSQSLVQALEQGCRRNPRLGTLQKLSRGLGVSIDELAGEGEGCNATSVIPSFDERQE